MRKPSFFIVGAPKCGTTSMCEYLNAHPNIFVAPKETHFFATDIPEGRALTSLPEYLKLYERVQDEHIAVGEASVYYLCSELAPLNIRDFNPDAKVVAMVRNPLDLASSYHQQQVYAENEDEEDIEKAWELQELRKKDERIPSRCTWPGALLYSDVLSLGKQVERLLRIFPTEQAKVIVFDDFVKDTEAVYEDLLAFLGVPSDGRTEFPNANPRSASRAGLRWLTRLVTGPPGWVQKIKRRIKVRLGISSLGIAKALLRVHSKPAPNQELSLALRHRLIEEFREDVEKLGELIGRDLSGWLEVPPEDQKDS